MRIMLAAALAALALAASPSPTLAQEELRVALPESHDLVELQPGLQVIPEFELEVFFTGNAYWLRADGAWYQARRPAAAATFALVDPRSVPAVLARLPAGSHLHYRPQAGQRRSTKVLAGVEPAEREAEVDAGPATVTPRVAPPPPAATPAQAAPTRPAPPPVRKAPAPVKKAPPPKKK